jgi:D-lactate dehydrogenase (cytochrome)
VPAPAIDTRDDLLQTILSDAAHVPGGFAAGIALPRDIGELAAVVGQALRVLPIGAQSSLTGGATPRGEVVVSTRALNTLSIRPDLTVRAGAGVALADLQRTLAARGLYYPPVPTFDGAFVGGTVATNAAGAATFKYGSTRQWVHAITVVLADGSILSLQRGQVTASAGGSFEIRTSSALAYVPVPGYRMPDVPKLSAGYFARPGMDLVDLFIGSEGTLGVIADATLRVIPLPRRAVALATSRSDAQAIAMTAAVRDEAAASWQGKSPLDVAAIEYIDAMSIALLPDQAFSRAGITRPDPGAGMLLVQIEVGGDESPALQRLGDVLDSCGCGDDPVVASPGDDRTAARLFELREAVPAAVNARVGAAQAAVHPDIQKTAGDMIVPFERITECLALYRECLERRRLSYAIWGHLSDGNLHPNVIPASLDDVERGRQALLEIASGVIRMGGSPLAEHGVGRSPLKQRLLRELYGEEGIEAMRAVKRALDPDWKLSPGVLFPEQP